MKLLANIFADDAQLHRQLGRRHCRMCPGYEDEATRKDWYIFTKSPSPAIHADTFPGDRIIVVVQKQRNFAESGPGASVGTSAANKVRRGDIRHAIVVRTVKKLQRDDGSVVKFDDNACVLINKAGEPIGTRLTGERADLDLGRYILICFAGVVGVELRKMKWSKILSLAPMHL